MAKQVLVVYRRSPLVIDTQGILHAEYQCKTKIS